MEWLKGILGEAYTEEIATAVKAEFPKHAVPKDQYNKKVIELEAASEQIETASKSLSELQTESSNSDEWKTKYDELQKNSDDYKTTAESRILEIQKKGVLKEKLISEGADPKTVNYLYNDFDLATMDLTEDGKSLVGFTEKVAEVKVKADNMFMKTEVITETPATGSTVVKLNRAEAAKSMSMADFAAQERAGNLK